MSLIHWNYFLALEEDTKKLSRYIEFCPENLATYSIENLRILMSATQEIDVLVKLLCEKAGAASSDIKDYRRFLTIEYSYLTKVEVEIPRHSLCFIPFESWDRGFTPQWWTANNDIKHKRAEKFPQSSLGNTLSALSALLLICLLYYKEIDNTSATLELLYLNQPQLLVPCQIGRLIGVLESRWPRQWSNKSTIHPTFLRKNDYIFHEWLNKLSQAWSSLNPQNAAELFAKDVEYHESVLNQPCASWNEVFELWKVIPQNQKDVVFSFKILAVADNLCIANWQVTRILLPQHLQQKIDGIFAFKLNKEGLCTYFKQWRTSENT